MAGADDWHQSDIFLHEVLEKKLRRNDSVDIKSA